MPAHIPTATHLCAHPVHTSTLSLITCRWSLVFVQRSCYIPRRGIICKNNYVRAHKHATRPPARYIIWFVHLKVKEKRVLLFQSEFKKYTHLETNANVIWVVLKRLRLLWHVKKKKNLKCKSQGGSTAPPICNSFSGFTDMNRWYVSKSLLIRPRHSAGSQCVRLLLLGVVWLLVRMKVLYFESLNHRKRQVINLYLFTKYLLQRFDAFTHKL